MKKIFSVCLLSCLIGNVTLAFAANRRGANPAPAAVVADGLSAEQMDNLLAPIALYPDPLSRTPPWSAATCRRFGSFERITKR